MNTLISSAIIARLEAEVCPVHGKSAKVFADKDVFSVTDACCPEFDNHLHKLYAQLSGLGEEPNPLLEQMFGLR